MPNNEYTFSLDFGHEIYKVSFISEFEPAYTSPRRLKSRYPALLSEASDMELWEVIYDTSLKVEFLTRDMDEIDPFLRERFVSCCVAVSWLRQAMMKDAWVQSVNRSLGDLTVSDKQNSPPNLLGLIKNLEEECQDWLRQLLAGNDSGTAWTEWQSTMELTRTVWE